MNRRRFGAGSAALLLAATAPGTARRTRAEATPTASGATRTIEHALGTTEVPANPQRVVAHSGGVLEAMGLLGVRPVGATAEGLSGNAPAFPSYLPEDALEGIATVGITDAPNLEAIAALNPDLILGMTGNTDDDQRFYDLASRIAPVVMHVWFGEDGVRWKEFFAEIAGTLNRPEPVAAIAAAYDGRTAEYRDRMGERPDATSISLVRFMPDLVRLYLPDSYGRSILADCGLLHPSGQPVSGFAEEVSLETIGAIDADVIFVAQSDPAATLYDQFVASPLWSRLGAVQAGRVYTVDSDVWIGGNGYLAANLILDDLERLLLAEAA